MFVWDEAEKTEMVSLEDSLPGRDTPVLADPKPHTVLGTELLAEPDEDQEIIYLASGCFWGAERKFWQQYRTICKHPLPECAYASKCWMWVKFRRNLSPISI